jgi:hypothetical protein
MGRSSEDITADALLGAYEAIVSLGAGALAAEAGRLRDAFQKRTGAFGPEDAWFEARSRAFWDDALTTEHFGAVAAAELGADAKGLAPRLARAHRGLFRVFAVEDAEGGDADAKLVDVWSGVELLVRVLDDAQRVVLEHAEGLMDARVVTAGDAGPLYVLPGAFHHAADATEHALKVLTAARERAMETGAALDALLRMELVFRSSSRVKAGFAYRVASLA